MRHQKIFLIGMPGSGKSTLGKKLAEELNLPFIDLDEEIEKITGKSIPEIFEQYGEDHFRELERKQLLTEIEKPTFLMATGGGTPCFFDNMEVMNKEGFTVFLDVPVDILVKRLSGSKDRPLLTGKEDLYEALRTKLNERSPFYQKTKLTIERNQLESLVDQLR